MFSFFINLFSNYSFFFFLDLIFYLNSLKEKIGNVGFVICLDSGCMDYESLWVTTSLRGVIGGTLSVSLLKEGNFIKLFYEFYFKSKKKKGIHSGKIFLKKKKKKKLIKIK